MAARRRGRRALTHGPCERSCSLGATRGRSEWCMKCINHWDSDRVRMFCQSWWLGFQVGGGRGGEISGKSFVHIRRVHIGGFSPPVEKYFIMVAASWFSPRRRIMVPTAVRYGINAAERTQCDRRPLTRTTAPTTTWTRWSHGALTSERLRKREVTEVLLRRLGIGEWRPPHPARSLLWNAHGAPARERASGSAKAGRSCLPVSYAQPHGLVMLANY